jgi:aryl-alcohol dehydrogenase-like predicted oxidoreductase
MGMSEFYGTTTRAEAIATIHRALELGVTCLDSPTCTGRSSTSARRRAIAGRRDDGRRRDEVRQRPREDGARLGIRGDAAYVRECVRRRRSGASASTSIDLYYQHRVDPETPIEETVGAMAELVAEGKVGSSGSSEAGRRRSAARTPTHPISALQSEWSLWERGVEAEILPTVRALGIGFVPYSPLGRGFLTGRSAASRTSSRATSARTASPGSSARTSSATSRSSSASTRSPPGSAARRASSRWPGSSPRATTSCPSRARSASAAWRRTPRPRP